MALSKPDYPTYGPETFTKLQELVDTFYANDEELKDLIDNIAPSVSVDTAAITLASGYSNNSSYVASTAIKMGNLVTIDLGLVNCPSSIGGNQYYTLGTMPSGYRPTGKHRMGVGMIYAGTVMKPVQLRLNTDGSINFLSAETVSNASYLFASAITFAI
ncbi:hypothetical protein SEA_FINNY_21 [Microbacterium phage Finny]|uniref:Minor tail protein n=1 Tax=Microbacterium phage Finny TaxID=2590878 RepID=A0A4Y6EAQ2_9CAUD|nr:hypothetical protein SEA_FINNY_21 [Microbacterium phage Finny]